VLHRHDNVGVLPVLAQPLDGQADVCRARSSRVVHVSRHVLTRPLLFQRGLRPLHVALQLLELAERLLCDVQIALNHHVATHVPRQQPRHRRIVAVAAAARGIALQAVERRLEPLADDHGQVVVLR
jgi:hypothetical protein